MNKKNPRGKKHFILLLIVTTIFCIFANLKIVSAQQGMKQKISPDLRSFLENYFSTWSNRDMKSYKSHFHERAIIMLIENGQVRQSQSLDAFINHQANLLSTVTESIVEQMTSFTADEDNKAATVTAQWLLMKGKKSKKGVDRFTIIRDLRGGWKIVSLVWYINE